MAITTANIYVTTDGKKFDNELDAKAHEMAIEITGKVEAFLDAAGIPAKLENGRGNPRRESAKNVIIKWEAYLA